MEYKVVGKPTKKRVRYSNKTLTDCCHGNRQVRWADLEAAKEEMRKKEIGFSLGTGWSKVTEEEVERILHQNVDSDNHSNKIIEQDEHL